MPPNYQHFHYPVAVNVDLWIQNIIASMFKVLCCDIGIKVLSFILTYHWAPEFVTVDNENAVFHHFKWLWEALSKVFRKNDYFWAQLDHKKVLKFPFLFGGCFRSFRHIQKKLTLSLTTAWIILARFHVWCFVEMWVILYLIIWWVRCAVKTKAPQSAQSAIKAKYQLFAKAT